MRPLDWAVMFAWLVFLVSYGLWRGRGSASTQDFMLANKTMPWYAMGLSIIATQASAITFISTTAQAYVDGMRFVQFYFGLPLAMVILSATAVPIFHRAKVYTAYEYLEHRFDARTRLLVTIIFLISRGLGAGLALAAPAIVLSVVLGWPFSVTILIMGGLVVLYTTLGGIKAVTWADVLQMAVIMLALVIAFGVAISMLPPDVSFLDAVKLAGAAGKLNAVTTTFDWNDRYNIWSGLIGGMFLALAYFGTDQSQVQRYLTGKSIGQSRLGLLLTAMVESAHAVLHTLHRRDGVRGVSVRTAAHCVSAGGDGAGRRHRRNMPPSKAATNRPLTSARPPRAGSCLQPPARFRIFAPHKPNLDAARADALNLNGANDTNYIFLSFVTHYLPVGVVGLVVAVIFTAAMSAISGEINSLATVTVIDIYKRHIAKNSSDKHYLAGIPRRDSILGNLRHGFCQHRHRIRRADRGRQPGRVVVLRRDAGRVRAGVLREALHGHRRVRGGAGRRSRDLRHRTVYCRISLV